MEDAGVVSERGCVVAESLSRRALRGLTERKRARVIFFSLSRSLFFLPSRLPRGLLNPFFTVACHRCLPRASCSPLPSEIGSCPAASDAGSCLLE